MMRGEFELPDIEDQTPKMIMNGPNPFFHPITNVLVGPYQYYEGYAHQEHENAPEEEPEKKTRTKKEGA